MQPVGGEVGASRNLRLRHGSLARQNRKKYSLFNGLEAQSSWSAAADSRPNAGDRPGFCRYYHNRLIKRGRISGRSSCGPCPTALPVREPTPTVEHVQRAGAPGLRRDRRVEGEAAQQLDHGGGMRPCPRLRLAQGTNRGRQHAIEDIRRLPHATLDRGEVGWSSGSRRTRSPRDRPAPGLRPRRAPPARAAAVALPSTKRGSASRSRLLLHVESFAALDRVADVFWPFAQRPLAHVLVDFPV